MADKLGPTPPPKPHQGQSNRAFNAQWKRWANKKTSNGLSQKEVWDKHIGEIKEGIKSRAGQVPESTLTPEQQARSNEARAKNAGKPGYDSAGNPLSEKEKLKIKQRKDLEEGIDLGELREKGYNDDDAITTLAIEGMSPEMKESYEKNKGNPKFNEEMDDYREKKEKGELTNEDRIRILNRNKDLLQISQLEKTRRVFGPIVNTARNALAIVKSGVGVYKTLSGFK